MVSDVNNFLHNHSYNMFMKFGSAHNNEYIFQEQQYDRHQGAPLWNDLTCCKLAEYLETPPARFWEEKNW